MVETKICFFKFKAQKSHEKSQTWIDFLRFLFHQLDFFLVFWEHQGLISSFLYLLLISILLNYIFHVVWGGVG